MKSSLYSQPLPSPGCPHPLCPALPLLFSSNLLSTHLLLSSELLPLFCSLSHLSFTLSLNFALPPFFTPHSAPSSTICFLLFDPYFTGFHSLYSCPSHSRAHVPGSQGNLAVVCPVVNSLLKLFLSLFSS